MIKFRKLFTNPIEEIVNEINESLQGYSSEDMNTEDLSQIIFNKLLGNGVKSRIIKYTFNNQPIFSVQYYNKGRWANFNYAGLDLFFQPIYSKTLNPTDIVEEKEGY